ncbi:translation elongation factor Ts [Candidatus Nomurabacteria bacterium]|nr:translation elongation factor Ts [Candidatus Nomurabacteria bacterium]MCB9820715.1 translation elongation factor Ts [Candidatus Nomurabacteria bacterium]
MAEITTELVKELRDKTNVSIMQCKKALEETGGDIEAAMLVLRKISGEVASKKADRETSAGIIGVAQNGNKAVMVTLNCETDFVAQNEDFKKALATITQIYLDKGEDALKSESEPIIKELVLKIGENIVLGEYKEISGDTLGVYLHHNQKTACVVSLEGGDESTAKDIAMHIAAMNPKVISKEDIDPADMEKTTEFFKGEVEEQAAGKPEDIKQKMLDGKISSYLKDVVLLEQPFFKDESKSIKDVLGSAGAKVVAFERTRIL